VKRRRPALGPRHGPGRLPRLRRAQAEPARAAPAAQLRRAARHSRRRGGLARRQPQGDARSLGEATRSLSCTARPPATCWAANRRSGSSSPRARKAGFVDYAAALTGQNQKLAELLTDADWSVPVPTCPGWTLLQLLRHVGRGDRWAAQIITDRADTSLDPRLVKGGKPPADAPGAIRWLSQSPRMLLARSRTSPGHRGVHVHRAEARRRWTRGGCTRQQSTVPTRELARSPLRAARQAGRRRHLEWLERLADEQALGRPASLPAGRAWHCGQPTRT